MRIRTRLLLLVLSVLGAAFAAASFAVWYVYSEEQRAQERGISEATRAFALLVGKELQVKEGMLRTLAASPLLAGGSLQEFYTYARSIAGGPESTIILSDLNGKQLLNTRLPYGADLPVRRSSNIAALMQQYGADRTLISDVFLAPIGKRHDYTIQVPVKAGDDIRYVLTMGTNAASLQALFAQQHFPEAWIGTIVDRQGAVVSRSRDPDQFTGKVVREYTRQILANAAEGIYPSVTLEGIPVKAFFSQVPNADWKVLVSIPDAEIRRLPTRAALFLAAMMLVPLTLALVVARKMGNQAVVPIQYLGRTAEQLGRGEEISYTRQGLFEIDSVGHRIVEASKQIRRAKSELEERVALAVAATERAQTALLRSQKLEALGRLTGGIAHEFNNLLQTLTTALQLAALTSNQPRVQALIATCQKTVGRATVLSGQLGSFGRIQDARLVTLRLDQQVNSVMALISGALKGNIAIDTRFAEDLWPVTVDPLQLELALLNVAMNARDAMPDGGSLTLAASNVALAEPPGGMPAGDYVLLSITDTGAGMAPDVLAKALDPFFTTKSVGQGTGLGLPQAYGFATQSHGTLMLRSAVGEGTTVDIYLPRAHTPVSTDPAPEPGPGEIGQADGTVLFVEDDSLVREAMVPALKTAGFDVLVAVDGEEALGIIESGRRIDIVFSDIVMPGSLSGVDLARIVQERFPSLRVVLATGYSDQRVAIPGVQVLAKPYELGKVVAVLAGGRDR
jgi:signal transduction histidine kinase/CheY-like chemotaxis protein